MFFIQKSRFYQFHEVEIIKIAPNFQWKWWIVGQNARNSLNENGREFEPELFVILPGFTLEMRTNSK